LLQGPYFCAEDLAGIALQLDAEEAQLLGTGAVVAGAASNNVDDSGNFSIQVLSEALRRAHGVTLDQDANELAATLTTLSDGGLFAAEGDGQRPLAFVCNLREHWFAIRSLRGEVWNLNSLQVAPAKISAGEGCAQVLFFESDEVCETSYKDRGGKYQGQRGVTLPKA
jgi:hypothetical protein